MNTERSEESQEYEIPYNSDLIQKLGDACHAHKNKEVVSGLLVVLALIIAKRNLEPVQEYALLEDINGVLKDFVATHKKIIAKKKKVEEGLLK